MTAPTVFIVDDDPGIRHSLALLLETADLKSEGFANAEDFLSVCEPNREGCLLLDVRMPGMSGPELQKELARRNIVLPIIFLTGHADLPIGIEAIKSGASDFLTKPIDGELVLIRVDEALRLDVERHQKLEAGRQFRNCLLKLTMREREILALALSGLSNKEISGHLKISRRTVEGHRSRIILKIGHGSLLKLAKQAAVAGVSLAEITISEATFR